MYNVPKFTPKVYLIHKDGRRWEFKNITEAANTLWKQNYLGYYNGENRLIGSNFTERHESIYVRELSIHRTFSYFDYIVRSEIGEVITVDDLKAARTNNHISKWLRNRVSRDEFSEKHFRTLPIPYTRCRRGGYSYYRKIRTTAEHRENNFLLLDEDALEYNIKARPRRYQNLPNSWDDIHRSDHRDKGWKRHRKHQWKEKS